MALTPSTKFPCSDSSFGTGGYAATLAEILAAVYPVGSVYIGVLATDPATLFGFGTWSALGAGRVLVGINAADPDFDVLLETGGAKTVAGAGTVSQPTFTGSASQSTSAVSAGTPAGTVSQPTFTGTSTQSTSLDSAGTPAGTVAWPAGVPTAANESAHTHSVTAAGTNANESSHTHGAGTLADATSGSTVKLFTASGTGVSAATHSGSTAAGTAHTHTFTGSAVTSAVGSAHTHTISWPAGVPTFAGSALATHSHTYTAAGVVSQPTFTGSALGTHAHTLTPAGTVSQPTHTGTPTSVVQPYLVVAMWQRTA